MYEKVKKNQTLKYVELQNIYGIRKLHVLSFAENTVS